MMKNNKNQKPHRSGFTLVEVMVVLFILVMIMGIFVVAVQGRRESAQRQTALIYVRMLATQVNNYDLAVGRPPTTEQGLAALVTCPSDVSEVKWGGPYLESNAKSIDPWDNPYQYACPGKHGRFDIWSFGPDMMDGTDDDIGNWMNDL